MKVKVYSVFDSKAAFYGTPFFSHNDGTAVRSFYNLVNSSDFKNPEDFSLFSLGDFDDSIGKIDSMIAPLSLCTASSLIGRSSVIAKKVPKIGMDSDLPSNGINNVKEVVR